MRRREFISFLVGAAVTWPLAARAQQNDRMRRIGVLLPATADDTVSQTRVGAFLQELALLDWTIGRNVRIDVRWASTNPNAIRRHAVELVSLTPDVILAAGELTMPALLQATRTIPIVFPAVVDPVANRYVDSLCAAGRQRHRVHDFRHQHERQMAGAA